MCRFQYRDIANCVGLIEEYDGVFVAADFVRTAFTLSICSKRFSLEASDVQEIGVDRFFDVALNEATMVGQVAYKADGRERICGLNDPFGVRVSA